MPSWDIVLVVIGALIPATAVGYFFFFTKKPISRAEVVRESMPCADRGQKTWLTTQV